MLSACKGTSSPRRKQCVTTEASVGPKTVKKCKGRGAWVAQSVKHPTLNCGSGPDLTVRGIEPHVGLCADSAEPAWNSLFLSLSLSAPPPLMLSISASHSLKNKEINI